MALFSTVNLFPQRSPSGFRPWEYIPTALRIKNESTDQELVKFSLPFGEIPENSTPASKFLIFSPVSHCNLFYPWSSITIKDAFLPFNAGGGGLVGALGAVSIATSITRETQLIRYRLGTNTPPPTVGYNIGNIFSEKIYYNVVMTKNDVTGGGFIKSSGSDVSQRYRLKRFYLHHGEIQNISNTGNGLNSGELAINLGIDGAKPIDLNLTIGGNIIKKSGTRIAFTIKRFLSNFNAVIDVPDDIASIPSAGDFYILDDIVSIEDPYLMGGIFWGRESDPYISNPIQSGLNTLNTDVNKCFIYTNFVGGYALKSISTSEIITSGVGTSMNDSEDTTWVWATNNKDSDIYPEKNQRFRKTTEFIASTDSNKETAVDDYDKYYPVYNLRDIGAEDDIFKFAKTGEVQHIRLELAMGGSTIMNNFHAPILKNEYIIQNGKYFKILDQIDGTIIDVSYFSVDGETQIDINSPVQIINQFAWKICEHYIQNEYPLQGTINSIDSSNNSIEIFLYERQNIAAFRSIGGGTTQATNKRLPYMEVNSFLYRFLNTFPHDSVASPKKLYTKGNKWAIQTLTFESILYASSIEYMGQEEGIHKVKMSMVGALNPAFFKTGTVVNIRFDEPFIKTNSQFWGGNNVFFEDGGRSGGGRSGCMSGNFTSPLLELKIPDGTTFGICANYLWGVSISAPNYETPFFITTPEGLTSISSSFCTTPKSEAVLYKDAFTGKATLRQGFLDFKDEPIKQEIAMGLRNRKIIGPSGSKMDTSYERLNSIYLEDMTSAESKKESYITFSIGNENDIYGFPITGKGSVDLQALRITEEVIPGQTSTINASMLNYEGRSVSPVYIYKPSVFHQRKYDFIPMGVETSKGAIFIKSNLSGKNSEAKIYGNYVNDNQTIDASGAIDVLTMKDGEKIVFYNKILSYKFYIDDKLNESGWKYSDSTIMITGSQDFGNSWGAPFLSQGKRDGSPETAENDPTGITYLPLMIGFACEYLGAIYNQNIHALYIFAKCYDDDGVQFLGMFTIYAAHMFKNTRVGYHTELKDKNIFDPEQYKDYDIPFLFRPLNLPDEIRNDKDRYFTSPKNTILFNSDSAKNIKSDYFVRVMGNSLTKSSIIESEVSWGTMSFRLLPTGHIIFFYDSPIGIQMGFSLDGGRNWQKSKITLSKNGKCGFMICDEWFFYLIPGKGLYLKKIHSVNLQQIMDISKGDSQKDIELLQKKIDDIKDIDIGTEAIEEQRFSGHKTNNGIFKVFYYDQSSNLACTESNDGTSWNIAPNF